MAIQILTCKGNDILLFVGLPEETFKVNQTITSQLGKCIAKITVPTRQSDTGTAHAYYSKEFGVGTYFVFINEIK